MSELSWRNIPLDDIARLDMLQVCEVLCRKRDAQGNLIRCDDELPEGMEVDEHGMRVISKPCSYGLAYIRAKMYHGVDELEARRQWNAWWEREHKHCIYSGA